MNEDTILNSIDFRAAKHLFEKWRANKKTPAEQVPDKLWFLVSRLIRKDFPIPSVLKNLGLNKDQALRYFISKSWNHPSNAESNSMNMVEVKNPQVETLLPSGKPNGYQILIQHTQGHQLSVSADKELAFGAIKSFMS